MALTAAQRRRLPRSAYLYAPAGTPHSAWRYPAPTRAQARKAGISEAQRQRNLRNAVARAAQPQTRGTRRKVEKPARRRAGAVKRRPGKRRTYAWRTSARPSQYTQRRAARYRRGRRAGARRAGTRRTGARGRRR